MRLLYFVFLILLGCASNVEDRSFVAHKSEDLGKKLGIQEDKLKKFEVISLDEPLQKKKPVSKKTEQVNETPDKKSTTPKKASTKTKPPVIKKTETAEQSKEELEKLRKKSEGMHRKKLEVEEPSDEKSAFPEDYPEEFKKYDKKSKAAWEQVKPYIFIGEEFTFRMSYLGITAGHIKMETKPMVSVQGEKAYRFKAFLRSSRYYQLIYTLDDSLESVVLAKNFLPVKYTLIQRESKQDVDDLQLFDHESRKTYVWYKRLKNDETKKLEFEKFIPGFFQDSYSSLYFVRGLPLGIGDVYEFPVVTRGKVWLLTLKVERKEKIDVNGEEVEAYRINAETRYPGVLEKKGDIIFWYSTDSLRRLLKFNAKIKIGSVEGELVEFTPGEPIE
jgi:hypothetical protein